MEIIIINNRTLMNIIEPCCAERQLGQLLREKRGQAVMFQTNGDVTITKFLKATMLMSGDRPRTLTISTPLLPERAMRTVRSYAELGYIAKLRLLLNDRPSPTVLGDFPAELELSVTQNAPSLLMWQGTTATVVIQGAMPDATEPALHLYAGLFCGNQSLALRAATDPFESLFRARRVEISIEDSKESPTETETKKKSNRKTKKSNEKSNQKMAAETPTEEKQQG